jgi:hypothetical protein
VEDKNFLACKGSLYMVTREQLIKIMAEFVGKTPVEKVQHLTELAEQGIFKQIHI